MLKPVALVLSALAFSTVATAQPNAPIRPLPPRPVTTNFEAITPRTVGFVHTVAKSFFRPAPYRMTCIDHPELNGRKDAIVTATLNAAPANAPVGLGYHYLSTTSVLWSDSWNADATAKANKVVGLPAGRWCILSSIPTYAFRGTPLVALSIPDFDRHMKELEATYDKTFTSLSYNVIAYLPK